MPALGQDLDEDTGEALRDLLAQLWGAPHEAVDDGVVFELVDADERGLSYRGVPHEEQIEDLLRIDGPFWTQRLLDEPVALELA